MKLLQLQWWIVFFSPLNHSKSYLCWSSTLIHSVSTRSVLRGSPVSRVDFTLLDNIYILQLANLVVLEYPCTSESWHRVFDGKLPVWWRVRTLLNVHFITPLKQKTGSRGLIKWFITAKVITQVFPTDEQDLPNVLKTLLFVDISPYLCEWRKNNVIITSYKLSRSLSSVFFTSLFTIRATDKKWAQMEQKIDNAMIPPPERNTKPMVKVWC